ncbi:MAG: hypothetical protein ACLFNN_03025 [Candidatus Paceibacterota bacterium]
MEILSFSLLFVFSVIGIFLALKVFLMRFQEKDGSSSVAMSSCLFSKNSFFRFLGVPFDVLAGLYLTFLLVLVTGTWFLGGLFWGLLFLVLIFGVFFSIYALIVQVVAVRDLCKWTLAGALVPFLNLSVFLMLAPMDQVKGSVLFLYEEMIFTAVVFSLVGSVLTAISFFVFLSFMEDLLISRREAVVLSFISEAVWIFFAGLFSLVVIVFLLTESPTGMQIWSLILGVTLVAGICELTKITRIRPALVMVSLKKGAKEERELLKRLAFGVEAISLLSWIFVTFLLFMPENSFSVQQVAGVYTLSVIVAFLLSQLVIPDPYEKP